MMVFPPPQAPNACAHLLPEAEAQRKLEAVRCSAWFGADLELPPAWFPPAPVTYGKRTHYVTLACGLYPSGTLRRDQFVTEFPQ
jgi:hypothetical protein